MNAIIFDMDGLLLDTESLYLEAAKEVFPKLGYDYIPKAFHDCIGQNQAGIIRVLTSHYGLNFDINKYFKLTEETMVNYIACGKLKLKPYVRETLTFLKANDYKIALGTSTYINKAKEHLKKMDIEHFFDICVGGDMVQYGKPSPDIFLKAATLLNVPPEETIVLEDSFNGVIAGHTGGFLVVMIPDILQPTPEISVKCTEIHKNLKDFVNNSLLLSK